MERSLGSKNKFHLPFILKFFFFSLVVLVVSKRITLLSTLILTARNMSKSVKNCFLLMETAKLCLLIMLLKSIVNTREIIVVLSLLKRTFINIILKRLQSKNLKLLLSVLNLSGNYKNFFRLPKLMLRSNPQIA